MKQTKGRMKPERPIDSFTSVKDSGKRQEFETGSRRDSREGKGRFDLLPPYAITRLAIHFENGATKYGDGNYLKGQPTHRYMESALRHLFKYIDGDREEDHLSASAWNILALISTEKLCREDQLPGGLDDYKDATTVRG